jgi:hypothetical protein
VHQLKVERDLLGNVRVREVTPNWAKRRGSPGRRRGRDALTQTAALAVEAAIMVAWRSWR